MDRYLDALNKLAREGKWKTRFKKPSPQVRTATISNA